MKRQKGFSLVQFLVVMTIVGILAAIGVPSFKYVSSSYRLSGEVNSLLGDLQYARAEALKEGQTVTACVSANGTTCSGTNTWQSGWIVYSNPTNSTVPAAGSVLKYQAAFLGTTPDTFIASSGINAVTFNREGFATTAAGFPNTTIVLHDPTSNPQWTRCLWITPVGLLMTETHANNPSGTCS